MDDRTLKTSVLALFSFVALSACGDDSSANGGSAQGGAGGTAGSGNGGEPGIGGAGPMAAEITRYDVDIDLTSDLATLALRLDVTAAGSCFSVPSERPALAVRFDDAPALSFTVDENLLTACSASELAVGEHTLAVDVQLAEKTYHGLDIGYSTTPDLSGSDFTYLLSWVGGCDHFGPCDDDPARLVSFGFNVTHPEGTVVLCPGALTSGPTETRCALDSTLAPTYSAFSVAADAAWVASPLLSVPSAEITLYEVPEELCVRRDPVPISEARLGLAQRPLLVLEDVGQVLRDRFFPGKVLRRRQGGRVARPLMHDLVHGDVHGRVDVRQGEDVELLMQDDIGRVLEAEPGRWRASEPQLLAVGEGPQAFAGPA